MSESQRLQKQSAQVCGGREREIYIYIEREREKICLCVCVCVCVCESNVRVSTRISVILRFSMKMVKM